MRCRSENPRLRLNQFLSARISSILTGPPAALGVAHPAQKSRRSAARLIMAECEGQGMQAGQERRAGEGAPE
jgi:hypothetical protein